MLQQVLGVVVIGLVIFLIFSLARRSKKGGIYLFFGEGWSVLKILLGIAFIIVGFCIQFFYVAFVDGGISLIYGDPGPVKLLTTGDYISTLFSFAFVLFGIFGWWFAIPAFQIWKDSRKGLAWFSLVAAIVIFISVLVCVAYSIGAEMYS